MTSPTTLEREFPTIAAWCENDHAPELRAECRAILAEVRRLRGALVELAGDGLWIRKGASWHDVGHMMRGVQQFALDALAAGEQKDG